MRYAFLQHKQDTGRLWKAGKGIFGLCAAWNHATNPSLPMTDREHHRSRQYARAIKNRMLASSYLLGRDYIELSNGELWPIKAKI